jgi:peptidoglycan/xylan/chitin deacetylase (PgdA/CDA1 family)
MRDVNTLVVFTASVNYSVRKGIVEIDRTFEGISWLIVLNVPRRRMVRLLRNQWRNFRRNGWRWIPYQASQIMHSVLTRALVEPPQSVPGGEFTVSTFRSRQNIQFLEVEDIHSPQTLAAVNAFTPDLGLSLAAPILRRSLFALPRLGTVNLHKGKLPDYRGMPPAFWELWNDESIVGCSVHWVDDKLDSGDLVCATELACERYSTLRGLQLRLDEVGVDLMREAVVSILRGSATSRAQAAGGSTYYKPTLNQVVALDRKIKRGQPSNTFSMRKLLKDWSAGVAFRLMYIPWTTLAKPRITVLLFHRVSDEARDNLTVGIEQFERQMALLSRYCHVLSIEQVIASDFIPQLNKPLACVTFDDGYHDNYVNAAPILMRHRIPAAFFVCTGMIGTERRFPHDIRRGNSQIPTMQWVQVRKLHTAGFTIGSHSVNHIDCAADPEETVRDELAQSFADLSRELGLKDVIFAYPYGGRKNMTPQRLELVKQAGYCACLSAYGGTNVGSVDRYNVLRRGIHWEYTDRAFLLTCLGLR